MSNLLAAATTRPADAVGVETLIILLPWLLIAFGIALATGMFRRRSVVGPARYEPDEHAVFFIILFLATIALGTVAGALVLAMPIAKPWLEIVGTAATFAAGIVVILLANIYLRHQGLQHFGLTLSRLPAGLWQGALGLFITLPAMLAVGLATEWLARMFQWPVPQHDVLTQLHAAGNPFGKILLIGMAVILAPLCEEMLFRGVLQTFFVRAIGGKEPAGREAVTRWLSIILTALLFAAIHRELLWIPPLFVLAAALGYAYEHTANLWIPITMHALFNAFQITIFLLSQHVK